MVRRPTRSILECIPNVSEGRDEAVIRAIAGQVEQVGGVQLLDTDRSPAANRTVLTFAGDPEAVCEAAYRVVREATARIDMRKHRGVHPRMGATDVCPLVPVSDIPMADTVKLAKKLGARIGETLDIPVFLYEKAATRPERQSLARIRSGEFEGMAEKLRDPAWVPDYGPPQPHPMAGVTAVGARSFLIAYNVNLKSESVAQARAIAAAVRESGHMERDQSGKRWRVPGKLQGVQAIGWYIKDYGCSQVSMNITDIEMAPLHQVYETVVAEARSRGVETDGSEVVGLVPLQAMQQAGAHYLPEGGARARVEAAIQALKLNAVRPFVPEERVLEWRMNSNKK